MAWLVRTDKVGGKAVTRSMRLASCQFWQPVPTSRADHGLCALQPTLNPNKPVECAYNTIGRLPYRCPIRRLGYTVSLRSTDHATETLGPTDAELETSRNAARVSLDAAAEKNVP